MESANILIIEDDAFDAEHLKLHLQQAGHRIVDVVTTGEEAIARATRGGIDLMVVDIVLPGKIDGIEAVHQIRKSNNIPVIFLTAYVTDELLLRAEQAFPFAYLLKPYRQREMEFMINMSLVRVQVEREIAAQRHMAENELYRAHAVIQHTNEGIMVSDSDYNILSVNPAFTQITGYEPSEVIGQKTNFLKSGRHGPEFYSDMWSHIERHGHWQGEIWNRRKNGEIYPEWLTINPIYGSDGSLSQYVGIFTDITSVKQSEAQLEHLAHHDPLTSLPNRILLLTRLRYAMQTAARHNMVCAILYLDLDRFKLINDSFGHAMGDSVLKAVAQRFTGLMRESDMVARLGGDEFVVLVDGIHDPLDASLIAEKITQSLESPVVTDGHEFPLTCSIGIATYPKDGHTVEELLRDADSAMYQAKKAGLNNIVFYSEEMTHEASQRIKLYSDLRHAVVNGEFELYYQPQLNMQSGALHGVEALIRWRHPKQGLILPAHFIPEAEDSGLIIPIGEWVINEACTRMKSWLDQGVSLERISVNVAGPQLRRGELVLIVKQALKQSGLEPERLELELTESYAMELIESHVDALNALHALGVTISIDDFGTGTSSLSRLKKLQVSKLKIDRSFVKDLPKDKNDEAITRAIIAMGKSLDLGIIAEGVETEEQKQFLLNENCILGQGFLFSKPLSRSNFESYVKSLADTVPSGTVH